MTEGAAGRRRADDPGRHGIDEILSDARRGVQRVEAEDLGTVLAQGGHVVDIRPASTREPEGHLPGATVIERLVLEWRLDPGSDHRMDGGPDHDDLVVVVCDEGYYSSLAARDLRDLGFHRATDLVGGFRAYADAGLPTTARPSRQVR
ncbi:MAG: rhodanese-like domain-containing protein [Brachybacterium sp.]|uniref:rhodanese-like domain-containing protein n=1 Tax=Brachybacterium sp. TaxID=1891286 RepID=UPI0026473BD1|nr:rhodanese-like domain-containing protein [Brachybacterium sp.]MDN5686724.1 rhodanese-like domain-containing protein [Brachybacterium sp.]